MDKAIDDYKNGKPVLEILEDHGISQNELYAELDNRDIERRGSRSKEERNQEIVRKYEDNKRTMRSLAKDYDVTYQRIQQILDQEDADIRTHDSGQINMSEEEIIDRIQQYVEEEGIVPSRIRWDRHPSDTYIVRKFGSWEKALWQAGYTPPEYLTKKEYTDDDITTLLDAFCERNDGPISMNQYDEMRQEGDPHPQTIISRFGSWSKALQEAGHTPKRTGKFGPDRKWTKVRMLNKLSTIMQKLDRKPTVEEWDEEYAPPSSILFRRRFDGWLDAVNQAREWVNNGE